MNNSIGILPSREPSDHSTRLFQQVKQFQDKIRKIDVRDFGAVGDGETADNESIQQAIDHAHNQNIPIVFIPAGRYHFEDEIRMKSNVSLQGESEFLTIFQGLSGGTMEHYISLNPPSGETLEHVTLSYFQIQATNTGLKEVGQIYNNTEDSIEHLSIHHVRIIGDNDALGGITFQHDTGTNQHVHISYCTVLMQSSSNYGIAFRKQTRYVWVTDCYIELVEDAYNSLALYADCNDFHVLRNICDTAGHSPIAVSTGQYGTIIGNIVRNCNVSQEGGIEVERKDRPESNDTSHHILVYGNIVENCEWGIFTHHRDSVGDPPYNILLSTNITRDCRRGIHLSHGNFITVSGHQSFNDNIGLRTAFSSDEGFGIFITNNSFFLTDQHENKSSGITLSEDTTNAVIYGNVTYGRAEQNGHGISIASSSESHFLIGNIDKNRKGGNRINDPTNTSVIWHDQSLQFEGDNQTALTSFEETTETVTFNGAISDTDVDLFIQRFGQWVTIHIPEINEPASSEDIIHSTPMSDRFHPSTHAVSKRIPIQDNDTQEQGELLIRTNGEIEIYATVNQSNFSSSGQHIFYNTMIQYSIF